MKKIAVAMSGGADSTFAAWLLKKKSYYVEGFTLKMLKFDNSPSDPQNQKSCCSLDAIDRAKQVCQKLGIKHTTLEITDLFQNTVIDYFINAYKQALTPNPCILCNRQIKFGYLLERILDLNFDYLATGHYAVLKKQPFSNKVCLFKNKDTKKDQSYFLSTLTSDQLKHILFPLASYNKKKVQTKLSALNLLPAKIRESQDVCFLGEYNDYRDFLKFYLKESDIKPGNFVTTEDKILGKHKGLPFYTIGQRRGLNISYSEPLYVKKLNSKNQTIVLGTKKDLLQTSFHIKNINLQCPVKNNSLVSIKIRYQFKPQLAKIKFLPDNKAKITFKDYATDITPGQQAVFYKKNKLLGSGESI